jgi:hypothetical protein
MRFRSSMAGLRFPLSTLHPRCYHRQAHDSRPRWIASPFSCGSFIRYSLPVFTAAFPVPHFPYAHVPYFPRPHLPCSASPREISISPLHPSLSTPAKPAFCRPFLRISVHSRRFAVPQSSFPSPIRNQNSKIINHFVPPVFSSTSRATIS